MLELLPTGIFETDADGRCRFVNRRWQAYTGLSAEAALGSGWIKAIHPDDRDIVGAEWHAAVVEGREFALEYRFFRPDGSTMWAAGQACSIRNSDGRVTGYVGTVTDVSAVVEGRHAQTEERRFLDAVLDIAGSLVCVFDGEGRILRFNRACELLTGYSFEEIRGRPFYEFLVPAPEIESVRADLAGLRRGQPPAWNENHWVTRDGRLRLISWSDVCFFDDDGRATHLISTGIDITDARRSEDAMRGIEAVGNLLAKTGPTTESMATMLATLSERMGYPYLALFVRNESGYELGAEVGYDGRAELFDPTTGIIGRVLRTASPAFVQEVAADPDWLAASPGVTSQIAVPLTADGETMGVLSIESTSEAPLGEADLRLIETVAERLSVALVLGREQQALKERARVFRALSGFARAAGGMVDQDLLVSGLLDGIADVVPVDAAGVTLLDRDSGRYLVGAVRGAGTDPSAVGREVLPGDGAVGRAIRSRTLVVEGHVGDHPQRAQEDIWRLESMAAVAVPLIHDGAVLGAITVGRHAAGAGAFTDLECEVLTLLGAQAALAVANAHLLAEVRALSIRDPLTGLFNRRHFDAVTEQIFARWRRHRDDATPIAAVMFDLDHFGRLNNDHGHQAGDSVLREFAGILLTRFRSADLVARYGGEEFVVILEGATAADAAKVAEEIRRDLEARVVRGPDGQDVRATVSAGCAEIDPLDPSREMLLKTADVALFMAKRGGRNRVAVA